MNISDVSFNPRARDGREIRETANTVGIPVSIHAPVMDAKNYNHDVFIKRLVSIHAPVMDANNPDVISNTISDVSIHAPVMDANIYACAFRATYLVSIHAPVMDAKPCTNKHLALKSFQSTRP